MWVQRKARIAAGSTSTWGLKHVLGRDFGKDLRIPVLADAPGTSVSHHAGTQRRPNSGSKMPWSPNESSPGAHRAPIHAGHRPRAITSTLSVPRNRLVTRLPSGNLMDTSEAPKGAQHRTHRGERACGSGWGWGAGPSGGQFLRHPRAHRYWGRNFGTIWGSTLSGTLQASIGFLGSDLARMALEKVPAISGWPDSRVCFFEGPGKNATCATTPTQAPE